MPELLKAPVTPAQQARDTLLGALVGLARATTNEPKTDDTDEVLNAGLRLAAQPDAPEERLQRMLAIVQTEKHRVAPAAPPVPCPAATRTITILSACGLRPRVSVPSSCKCFLPRLRWPKSARRVRRRPPFISCCSPLPRTGTRSFLPLLCNAPRSFAGSKSGPESRRFYPPGL